MQLAGKRFLVTGGGGFIGRFVVRELLDSGAHVRVMELPGRGDVVASQSGHTDHLELFGGNLTLPDDCRRACDGIDGVFHMGVLALNPSGQDPRRCVEVNVNGTFNIFEAARDAGVTRIVFSSASSVYGDTLEIMDEAHPLNSRHIYGASKIAGEAFLRAFGGMFGINWVALRYMNVYGPNAGFGLVDAVLKRIASGQAPQINGDGSQSFDFVYVSDVAGATVRAMVSDVTDEAFNVGSGEERTVKDVTLALLDLTQSDLKPDYRDVSVPMIRRVGSSEKASRLLDWRAGVNLTEGLRRVVAEQYFGNAPS